jgi:CheY-like chemotaxis protein
MIMTAAWIEAALKAHHVLVVEDSPFMQRLLTAMLRAIGVGGVHVAENGEKGLALMQTQDVDACIVDWLMHPMTGYEFLQEIRRNPDPEARRMPVIMCSAYTDRERVLQMRDAGADEILAKPVSPAKLYDRLVSALFSRRAFIEIDAYVGPDRRRRQIPIDFPDRRRHSVNDPGFSHVAV